MSPAIGLLARILFASAVVIALGWAVFPAWWALAFSIKREADFHGPTLVPFL